MSITDPPPPEYLTIPEAQRYVRVSQRTIYNWIQRDWIQVDRTANGMPRIVTASMIKPCAPSMSRPAVLTMATAIESAIVTQP